MNATVPVVDRPTATSDPSVSRLLRWLSRYAFRRSSALLAVLATMLARIALDLLKPWPMKVLVDHALAGSPVPSSLQWIEALPEATSRMGLAAWSIAGTVVVFLLSWGLGVATAYANIGFGQRMVYDLAADLFTHLQRLSLRFHARKTVGDSIRRVTTDCGCASVIISDALLPLVASLISLVAMFTVMWQLEPRLTLLAIGVVPWMLLVLRRYMTPMLNASYREQQAEGRLYDIVEQALSAVPAVQAFGRESQEDQRLAEAAERTVAAATRSVIVGLQFRLLIAAATAVGTASILWVGAQSVMEETLTIGELLVFMAYLSSLYGPLASVMYSPSTTQGAAGSARRVLEILETRREVDDTPQAVSIGRSSGRVQFEHVTFGYEDGRPVLQDITFGARPGELVAIVGSTGAGKSTLVSLVPRFFDPWQGRVLVDEIDVRELRLDALRANVALVLQEPFLFPVSVADNIAYGRPQATREEVIAAAQAARADAFITRLPNGYDTIVGERGATLSGGERQRLSVARALLKDAPILVLDEPTSAVDVETETQLLAALERLMAGRTTLIIAHRLSTIRRADRIVVLRDGRIAEMGTHDELLARGGVYARFHALQFSDLERPS